MTLLETLIEGRRRIAEVGWTQGAYARDVDGDYVHPSSPAAVCFCARGAINDDIPARAALTRALPAGQFVVHHWQDAPRRTREDVIALFDEAIADVRERAS